MFALEGNGEILADAVCVCDGINIVGWSIVKRHNQWHDSGQNTSILSRKESIDRDLGNPGRVRVPAVVANIIWVRIATIIVLRTQHNIGKY